MTDEVSRAIPDISKTALALIFQKKAQYEAEINALIQKAATETLECVGVSDGWTLNLDTLMLDPKPRAPADVTPAP